MKQIKCPDCLNKAYKVNNSIIGWILIISTVVLFIAGIAFFEIFSPIFDIVGIGIGIVFLSKKPIVYYHCRKCNKEFIL